MPAAKQKREGPNPANVILTALRRAVKKGVDPTRIEIMLDMAISATQSTSDDKPRQQADTFRRVADTLNGWSDDLEPAAAPQQERTLEGTE